MQKINFQDLPSTTTPLNASNMNAIQSNVEDVFNGDVPMGDIRVDSIKSKNLFNINNLTMGSGSVNYDTGTITVNQFANTSNQPLRRLCPNMVAGETYTLSFTTTSNNKYIYLVGSSTEWNNNTQHTITQAELDDVIYFYGNWQSTATITITDIQIEKGSSATSYAPFQNLNVPHYDEGSFSPTIFGDTTAGTANYTLQEGKYVRIGKLVHIEIRLGCTLTGSSGFLLIGNLPFSSYWREPGIISVVSNLTTSSTPWLCRVYGRNLLIGTCNLDNISNKNWSSTGYIYLTGTLIMP